MYPILFQIGPLTVYSFGTLMAVAALVGGWIASSELKRYQYDPDVASTMVIAAAVGGLLGARIFYIFEDWERFIQAPLDLILSGAGFTWYGGLFGGALAVSWVGRKKGISWLHTADICSPAVALAYGIGRIGCHIAGDGDWGTVTEVPWAVQYTNAIIGWVHPMTGIPYLEGVKVHPTPLYETFQSLVIFGILWSVRKKDYPPGVIFWLYLILAGLARFSVEFWRVNPVLALGMTQAQWLAIILVLLAGSMLRKTCTPNYIRPET